MTKGFVEFTTTDNQKVFINANLVGAVEPVAGSQRVLSVAGVDVCVPERGAYCMGDSLVQGCDKGRMFADVALVPGFPVVIVTHHRSTESVTTNSHVSLSNLPALAADPFFDRRPRGFHCPALGQR